MQYVLTILTRFGIKAVNLITFIVLARLLTLEDFANYGFIFNTSLLLSIFLDLGLRNSSAYYIGKCRSDFNEIQKSLIIYSLVITFFAVITPYIVKKFGYHNYNYEILIPSILICLGLFYIRTFQGLLLGVTQIGIVNKSDMIQKLILFSGVVALFLLDNGQLNIVLWIFATSSIFSVVYIFLSIGKIKSEDSVEESKKLLGDLYKRGFVFMLGAFFMIAYKKVGFYVSEALAGDYLTGIYFGINRFSEVTTEIGIAVSMVLFSKNVKIKEREKIVNNISKIVRVCIFTLSILTLLFAIFAEVILEFGLGTEFTRFCSLYRLALIAAFFGLVPTITFPTLTILYKPLAVSLLYLFVLIFNYFGSNLLYAYFGLAGIMFVLLLSNIILTSVILLFVCKKENVNYSTFLLIKSTDFKILKRKVYN